MWSVEARGTEQSCCLWAGARSVVKGRVRILIAISKVGPSKLGRSLGKLNSALSPRLQNRSLDRPNRYDVVLQNSVAITIGSSKNCNCSCQSTGTTIFPKQCRMYRRLSVFFEDHEPRIIINRKPRHVASESLLVSPHHLVVHYAFFSSSPSL